MDRYSSSNRIAAMLGIGLVLAMGGAAQAQDVWHVGPEYSLSSLLDLTLRSAALADEQDLHAAIHRLELRESVGRHPERQNVGQVLLDVEAVVASLPIAPQAALQQATTAEFDPEMKKFLAAQSADVLRKVTKQSWRLAVCELLVEARPAGYQERCQSFLLPIASGEDVRESTRARALVAVARGFQWGDLAAGEVQALTDGLMQASFDMKRLRLGVLGQVGNRQTLQFLEQSADHPALHDADVQESLDFAIVKLSYHLAEEPRARVGVLRDVLSRQAGEELLAIEWALDQAVQDGHMELLGLLRSQQQHFAGVQNAFLAMEFADAVRRMEAAAG